VPLVIGVHDARTGDWEVRSGLASGDTVMRRPGSNFKDGQKVDLVKPKAAPGTIASAVDAAGKGN